MNRLYEWWYIKIFTSLFIGKMQIKITMGFHYTCITMADFKRMTIPTIVKSEKQLKNS